MSTTQIRPGSVVVGVDGSQDANRALAWAADQAALEQRPLAVVHGGAGSADAQHVLDASGGLARTAHPGLDVTTVLAHDDARQVLVDASSTAATLVVGARGLGTLPALDLGSVSAYAVARASSPVVVVRSRHTGARPRVLVGVRFTPDARPVLEHAFELASLRDLPLTVRHCYVDTEMPHGHLGRPTPPRRDLDDLREQLADAVAGLREKHPDVEVDVDLTAGSPHDFLSAASSAYELVVVGRRSGSQAGRVVGTWVTLSIVEHAAGTVCVVPEAPALG